MSQPDSSYLNLTKWTWLNTPWFLEAGCSVSGPSRILIVRRPALAQHRWSIKGSGSSRSSSHMVSLVLGSARTCATDSWDKYSLSHLFPSWNFLSCLHFGCISHSVLFLTFILDFEVISWAILGHSLCLSSGAICCWLFHVTICQKSLDTGIHPGKKSFFKLSKELRATAFSRYHRSTWVDFSLSISMMPKCLGTKKCFRVLEHLETGVPDWVSEGAWC